MKLLSLFAKTKLNIFCSNITFALYLQQIFIQKYVSVDIKHDLTFQNQKLNKDKIEEKKLF